MKVENKVIVVTGGGNGMGRELVLLLLKKGAKVIAVDVNEATLKETAELAKSQFLTTFRTDITERVAIENLLKDALTVYGYIDGMINNAGIIQPFKKVNDLDYEAIERVFDINFYGALNMIKTFLPHLLTRPEAHIVNTSSMGGFLPVPGQIIYGASKAAVKLLTEGLFSELMDSPVKVSVVLPGAVSTKIKENSGIETDTSAQNEKKGSKKILSPRKAAEIIVKGMEEDKLYVFVGRDSRMTNKLVRLAPKFTIKMIAKKLESKSMEQ